MELSKENKRFKGWVLFIIVLMISGPILDIGFDMEVFLLPLIYGAISVIYYMLKKDTDESDGTKSFLLTWVMLIFSPVILCLLAMISPVLEWYCYNSGLADYLFHTYETSSSILTKEFIYTIVEIIEAHLVITVFGLILMIITILVCLFSKSYKKALMAMIAPQVIMGIALLVGSAIFDSEIELEVILPIVFLFSIVASLFQKQFKKIAISLVVCITSLPLMGLTTAIFADTLYHLAENNIWLQEIIINIDVLEDLFENLLYYDFYY